MEPHLHNPSQKLVVIGGGLMGSATAYQLSRHGVPVVLLEQQDRDYTYGSSFGEARISRSLGPKNDIFSFLQQCSVKETEGLINYLNQKDTIATHSMQEIYRTSPLTYIHYRSQKKEVDKILEDQEDPIEVAKDPQVAYQRFGMLIPDAAMVIRETKEYTGTLNPRILISKLHRAIEVSGNSIAFRKRVVQIEKEIDRYKITIADPTSGDISHMVCNKLILAAGPYNSSLIRNIAPYFVDLISPKRVFLTFFKPSARAYDRLNETQKDRIRQFYPIIDFSPEFFYSMIETIDHDRIPIIKVGGHLLRSDIADLDQTWKGSLTLKEIEWSKEQMVRYLKMIQIPLPKESIDFIKGYICVYSMTANEVPYVTPIIDQFMRPDPGCVLIGGMSGVGAKGALAYGLIASDILTGKERDSHMYQKARMAMGVERLKREINN